MELPSDRILDVDEGDEDPSHNPPPPPLVLISKFRFEIRWGTEQEWFLCVDRHPQVPAGVRAEVVGVVLSDVMHVHYSVEQRVTTT